MTDEKKTRGRPKSIDRIADALSPEQEQEEIVFETVREQARRDPKLNMPMVFEAPNGERLAIHPGEWASEQVQREYFEMFGEDLVDPDSELPRCLPVQALGLDSMGTTYYYFNTLGHVVQLKGEAGKGAFELLFAGRNNLLAWLFPRWNKKRTHVVGWEADHLKQALTLWAGWCETFDDEENVRGRGMWRDDFGRAVFHAGNAILIDGKWVKPGRYGQYIYPARPATGRPRYHRDRKTVGGKVLKVFQSWNWDRPVLDPILNLGYIMTAKMSGALRRRPFVWIAGPRGSGKSYLQTFSRSLMHGALFASSNATPASVYRRLGKDCIPVMLDEQEAKEDNRASDRMMEIIRAAYTGDGLDRTDMNGRSRTYALRSSFLASSINKPPMETSDDSRMALLSMRAHDSIPTEKPYDEKEAYRWGQALTQRAIDWYPRWDELLNGIERAMKTRKGHDARSVETFGPFLAGYHVAMHDDMPTAAQYAEYAALVDPSQLNELQGQIEDWVKCIVHLLGKVPEPLKHLTTKTIGQAMAAYLRAEGAHPEDVDKLLNGFRVCLCFRKSAPRILEEALLFIPNADPILHDLFKGTSWAGKEGGTGAWNSVLKQAPRGMWEDYTSSKGGFGSQRGVAFKLKALHDYLAGGHDDDPQPVVAAPPPPLPFDEEAIFAEYEKMIGGGDDA